MEIWINCSGFQPIMLVGEVLLGRSRSCNFHLPHESVSRKHAWIGQLDDGSFVLENRSSQALILNGEAVDGPKPVSIGDVLQIGPYIVRLTDEPESVEDVEGEATTSLSYAALQEEVALQRLADAAAEKKRLEDEIKRGRRELESEVWRGLHTHRELSAATRELEGLKEELSKLTHEAGSDLPTVRRPRPREVPTPRPQKRRRPVPGRKRASGPLPRQSRPERGQPRTERGRRPRPGRPGRSGRPGRPARRRPGPPRRPSQ